MNTRKAHLRTPELVVLALCTAIVIACFGAAGETGRKRAKEVVCLAHLHQWGSIFDSYIEDHDGNFNPGWDVGDTTLWMNALRPYYQDQWSLLLCPAAAKPDESGSNLTAFTTWTRTVLTPDGGVHRFVSSYGINSWTNNMTHSRGFRAKEWFWKSPKDVANANRIPVFADSIWHDAWPQATDAPPPVPIDSGWSGGSEMCQFAINRHGNAVNFLFMDWSARKVSLKELWTLKWHREYDTAGPWTRAGGALLSDWPEWMRDFKDY